MTHHNPSPLSAQGAADPPSDEALVAQTRQGSLDSYEVLIRRHNQHLFRVARAVAPNDAAARDAMQEGYIKAFQKLDQLQAAKSVLGWLRRIVRNEALMARRRTWRELTPAQPLDAHTLDEMDMGELPQTPEDIAIQRQWRAALERAIDRLSDDHREVFVLRAVQGLSEQEVAELIEIPVGTVKSRYNRARAALREDIERRLTTPLDELYAFDGAACDRLTQQTLQRIAHLQNH